MTYKGREITEDQITVGMVRDIVLTQYLTLQRCGGVEYKKLTGGYSDKNTVFNYKKILEEYKKYMHRPGSKCPIDLETGILKMLNRSAGRFLSDAAQEYAVSQYPWNVSEIPEVSLPLKTPIKHSAKSKAKQSYQEQLEDIRWTMFRTFVFVVRGQKCEQCGSTHYLNLHHVKYIPGRKAWEYNCNEVRVLCQECHEKIHNIQKST